MIAVLEVLRALRAVSSSTRGCTRIAYTEWEQRAHDLVWDTMRVLPGLQRVEDAAGNQFIVPETAIGPNAQPMLLIGSHLDTVLNGGWLDGTLGVVTGMAVLQRLSSDGRCHPRLGVVVFRDEEGVRFDTGLFGSHVFAGACVERDLDVADADGIRVRDVVPDPPGCLRYHPPVRPAAFLECHIEQGLRLQEAGARIGVVTGIVGIRRFMVRGVGEANHAGTTEMHRRVDALVPVARSVGRLPALVTDMPHAVVTCGRLAVFPGAPNIVPGEAAAVVEIRAGDDASLDAIEARLRALVDEVRAELETEARPPPARLQIEPVVRVEPTPTSPELVSRLVEVLEDRRIPYTTMPSMAGHDTQHAARRCPAGMFFVPSIDGISHNPAENSTDEDIELAADVMTAWVEATLPHLA